MLHGRAVQTVLVIPEVLRLLVTTYGMLAVLTTVWLTVWLRARLAVLTLLVVGVPALTRKKLEIGLQLPIHRTIPRLLRGILVSIGTVRTTPSLGNWSPSLVILVGSTFLTLLDRRSILGTVLCRPLSTLLTLLVMARFTCMVRGRMFLKTLSVCL